MTSITTCVDADNLIMVWIDSWSALYIHLASEVIPLVLYSSSVLVIVHIGHFLLWLSGE